MPRYKACFEGSGVEADHENCFGYSRTTTVLSYVALAAGAVLWLASWPAGWALPLDHGVVRFFTVGSHIVLGGGLVGVLTGWIGGYVSWIRGGRRCPTSAKKAVSGSGYS